MIRRSLMAMLALLVPAAAFSQQQTPEIYLVGEGVTPPSIVRAVQPAYTAAARAARVQGFVLVEAVVVEDGTVHVVRVIQSRVWSASPSAARGREGDSFLTDADVERLGLEDRAIDAAGRFTFAPGTRDGKPVRVRITMEIAFSLQPKDRVDRGALMRQRVGGRIDHARAGRRVPARAGMFA